jgi:hypothetical protein
MEPDVVLPSLLIVKVPVPVEEKAVPDAAFTLTTPFTLTFSALVIVTEASGVPLPTAPPKVTEPVPAVIERF